MVQDNSAIARMLVGEESPRKSVEQLIYAANKNGGADNIGVVVVHVEAG
jgi:serine/threonine protein phosphatase PrpC